MIPELSNIAREEFLQYTTYVARMDGWKAAVRETLRLNDAMTSFAESTIDGVEVTIADWPRPVRLHFIHPFKMYYERRPTGLFVVRLYHHARQPIA